MKKLSNLFQGKKTYITAAVLFVIGGLNANGVEIPAYVYELLGAFGIIAARSAVAKLQK